MKTLLKLALGIIGVAMVCLSFTYFGYSQTFGPIFCGAGVFLFVVMIILMVRPKKSVALAVILAFLGAVSLSVLITLVTAPDSVVEAKFVLEDGKKISGQNVEIVDACSHYGMPVSHEVKFPAEIGKIKKIVFVERNKESGKCLVEITNTSGKITQLTLQFYYEHLMGEHKPGLWASGYYAGMENKYSDSRDKNNWVDFVKYRKWYGEKWIELSQVKEINFLIN